LSKNNELSAYDLRIKKIPLEINLDTKEDKKSHKNKMNQNREKVMKDTNSSNQKSNDNKLEIIKEADIEAYETIFQNQIEEKDSQNQEQLTGSHELFPQRLNFKKKEEFKKATSSIKMNTQINNVSANKIHFHDFFKDHEKKSIEVNTKRNGHLMRPPFNNDLVQKDLTSTQSIFTLDIPLANANEKNASEFIEVDQSLNSENKNIISDSFLNRVSNLKMSQTSEKFLSSILTRYE